MTPPRLVPGSNIALKIPPHEYEATLAFYRDILQLKEVGTDKGGSPGFDFDGKTLWLDRVETMSQAEIWLEVRAEDLKSAEQYLEAQGVVRRDEIEPLPEDFEGFWITNAAGLIHLVSKE